MPSSSPGYIDHQIVSGLPVSSSRNRYRWTFESIRITFSAPDHIDTVRELFPGDTSQWEFTDAGPPFGALLKAQDALAFLSWLASETPASPPVCPSFFSTTIIPRIVAYLRRGEDAIAPNPTPEEQPQPGFSVRLNIGAIPISVEANGLVRYTFLAAAKLPEVAPDSPARLTVKVVPKNPSQAEAWAFLGLCVPAAQDTPGGVTLIGMHGFQVAEQILMSLLALEVELVRREWIVPARINSA